MTVSELWEAAIRDDAMDTIIPSDVRVLIADWRAMRATLLLLTQNAQVSITDTLDTLRLKP